MRSDGRTRIVTDHDELARRIADAQAAGRTVVWANGAFDVWHVGHTRFIEGAAAEGDVLVVGVNADASVRRNKGPDRPVHPLTERMEVVASMRAVDWVTSFEEDTCDAMLEKLRPDVHAKGPDYTLQTLPEGQTDRRLGIRFAVVGDPKNHSTTHLLRQVGRGRSAE